MKEFPGNNFFIFTLFISFFIFMVSCGGEPEQQVPPPPQVTVSKPLVRQIVEWDEYTGRLDATDSVEIRARVSGYLQSIHFDEGEIVDKGKLLFVIDPRPFQAALNRSEGEFELSAARLKLAQDNLARAKKLLEARAISKEEFDTRASEVDQAKASVESAGAVVEEAELNLEFTEVKSPIRGRISRELVTEGNLINGGTGGTLLTTIVSLDPIHVYFEADERSVLKYIRLDRDGTRPSSRDIANPVFLSLVDEKGFPHKGKMDFVDNRLDPNTGTMTGRAIFPNPDLILTPGLFARVRLQGSSKYEALQIPDEAVGTDQSQKFVLTVNDENIVKYKRVVLGPVVNGLRVVREGLKPDDLVITKGIQRARPDSKVDPVTEEIKIKKDSDTPDISDISTPSEQKKEG